MKKQFFLEIIEKKNRNFLNAQNQKWILIRQKLSPKDEWISFLSKFFPIECSCMRWTFLRLFLFLMFSPYEFKTFELKFIRSFHLFVKIVIFIWSYSSIHQQLRRRIRRIENGKKSCWIILHSFWLISLSLCIATLADIGFCNECFLSEVYFQRWKDFMNITFHARLFTYPPFFLFFIFIIFYPHPNNLYGSEKKK